MRSLLFLVLTLLWLPGCGDTKKPAPKPLTQLSRLEAVHALAALPFEGLSDHEKRLQLQRVAAFLSHHPGWVPMSSLEFLVQHRSAAPKVVTDALLLYLRSFPTAGYYPPRDDPTMVYAIERLVTLREPSLLGELLSVLPRITIEDPRALVRRAMARAVPACLLRKKRGVAHPGERKRGEQLLFRLLRQRDAPYALFDEAAKALGQVGFSGRRFILPLLKGLYRVRDRRSAATSCAMALGAARGEAKKEVTRLLLEIVRSSQGILLGNRTCEECFPKKIRGFCGIYRDALQKGWLRHDPILFENAAIRILAYTGSDRALHHLFASVEREALLKKWGNTLDKFTANEAVQNGRRTVPELFYEATTLPSFTNDLSVRGEVLHLFAVLHFGNHEPVDTLAQQGEGGAWSTFELPALKGLALLRPTKKSEALFRRLLKEGRCSITASHYYSLIRSQALNKALSSPAQAPALTAAWNNEVTTQGQWNATRRWWQPALVEELGGFKKCESELTTCLRPSELLRLEILEAALYHASPEETERLTEISPTLLMKSPPIPKAYLGIEGFVLRPWDKQVEAQRRAAVTPVVAKKIKSYMPIVRLTRRCKTSGMCYVDTLKSQVPSLLVRHKAGRMALLYCKELAQLIGVYRFMHPQERELLLERMRSLHAPSPLWAQLRQEVERLESTGKDLSNSLKFHILYANRKSGNQVQFHCEGEEE